MNLNLGMPLKNLRTRSSGKTCRSNVSEYLTSTFSLSLALSLSLSLSLSRSLSLSLPPDWLSQLWFTYYKFTNPDTDWPVLDSCIISQDRWSLGIIQVRCPTLTYPAGDQEGGPHHAYRDAGSSLWIKGLPKQRWSCRLDWQLPITESIIVIAFCLILQNLNIMWTKISYSKAYGIWKNNIC